MFLHNDEEDHTITRLHVSDLIPSHLPCTGRVCMWRPDDSNRRWQRSAQTPPGSHADTEHAFGKNTAVQLELCNSTDQRRACLVEGGGTGNDLDELARDDGLARAVEAQLQRRDHVTCDNV